MHKQYKPMLIAFGVVLALDALSNLISVGKVLNLLSLPALVVIMLTSLARVNDITLEKTGRNWQVRRVGFCLSGAAAVMLGGIALFSNQRFGWSELLVFWGVALVWLTTPNMPPWWRYVTGEYKAKDFKSAVKDFFTHFSSSKGTNRDGD